jgi:hypothetical protein
MLTTALLVLVVLLAVAVLASRHLKATPPEAEDISAEEAVQAAVELHAIRRRFDVAWTRHELRRDSAQLRRDLADEMESPEHGDG